MTHYYIGWDVGAWNCDEGDSRDALCVLEQSNEGLHLCGKPWRGNLHVDLVAHSGPSLIKVLLEKCGQQITNPASVTFAIDTPLGWPSPMLDLLHSGNPCNVPEDADSNPYLFRRTELLLFQHEARPLSCVRDMIGSQSTKGLHALRKCGLVSSAGHVWRSQDESIRAIETYPSPCRNSQVVQEQFSILRTTDVFMRFCRNWPNVTADTEDSLICAIVAWIFSKRSQELRHPDQEVPVEEGWIWLPNDCFPAQA